MKACLPKQEWLPGHALIVGMAAWCAVLFIGGCTVGPNYQRPPVNAPAAFRAETQVSANSFADLPWWQVFHDETLQQLIRTALTNNYDLRIAVTRIEQEHALAVQARSQFFPQVDYAGSAGAGQNISDDQPAPTGTRGAIFSADANASWEIDLWGKLRRQYESANAQYAASQEAEHDAMTSLIAEVAQDYFQLLALDRELAIAKATTNSFGESYRLFDEQLRGGVASRLETASAAALMHSTAATIPELEQQIMTQEDQLSVLLGQNPGPIVRGHIPLEKQIPPAVPAGLPSSLLERRPDIREAEQQLRSANAQLGVAKANFFPQLDLTGLFGEASTRLSSFVSGGDVAWGVAAGLTGPLFHGGQIRAQYAQARAARDQYALQYQQTVLTAFQEVSDALVMRKESALAGKEQAMSVSNYEEAVKVALERFRQGDASYYEVLQEQQQLLPEQNALVQSQLNELLAVVQLYRALGGGWETDARNP